MMDAVAKYKPDFIYTDGTDQQPFSGSGTGTGYKCDAMQRVIADFYNRTLADRGEVDVFSIVKFRSATNGTVNTCETGIPGGIKNDQAWIAESPVGDWFYGPDFVYSPDAVIRYILEIVSRDGAMGLSIPIRPDGSLDETCVQMLGQVGDWMRINGDGIYGISAWKVFCEVADGVMNVLPGGRIGSWQADHPFHTTDFRFTKGKDGALYAWCMTVPAAGEKLAIGVPMGLQFSITAIGSIMLQSANNALGTACVAAFTAAMRIKMFVMCPLDALGMAMATYTGQNYGAGKPDRILSGVKSATLVMVEYSVVIAAVMWALADKFALLFISPAETEIMKDTVLFLHINTSSFILLGSLSILRYTIQGAGYTRLSIFSGVSEMIARVLVSLYLVPALKFVGVCLGDPTAWLFANLFLIPAFVYVYHQLKGRMSINGVPANA